MGQRSQIIVKYPKLFWNADNPNNREPQFKVYHNQWLYGYGFIEHLRDILNTFKLICENETHYSETYPTEYRQNIEKAIKCANYKNPLNIRGTHAYYQEEGSDNEVLGRETSWKDVFKSLDNNNGFIFIKIADNGTVAFDIVNGLEDADSYGRRTPKEYLGLFYSGKDWDDSREGFEKLFKEMEAFNQFDYNSLKLPKCKETKFTFRLEKNKVDVYSTDESSAYVKAYELMEDSMKYGLRAVSKKVPQ